MTFNDLEIGNVKMRRLARGYDALKLPRVGYRLFFLHGYLYKLAGFAKVFISLSYIALIYKLDYLVYMIKQFKMVLLNMLLMCSMCWLFY